MAAGEPPPGAFLYFAYGSNLDVARLRRSCASARLVTVARLDGFRLAFTRHSARWGGGVADIRPAPNDHVWGALWSIDLADAVALDAQEGVSRGYYERIRVGVITAADDHVRCLTYRVVHPAAAHIAPSRDYLDTMLRGARAVGLPRDYVALLEGIAVAG